MQYTDKYRSPLGEITLASDGDHLTGLWFDGQKYFAATLSAEHQERELPIFEQAKEWLDSYFMGKIPSFTPPIHLEDTPFRLAVWDLLSKIPYGEVVTYKVNCLAWLKTLSGSSVPDVDSRLRCYYS